MYEQCNIEVRSCNHCCSGKAINITYSECVSVALVIQHAKCICHIVISGLSYLLTYTMVQSSSWAANRFAASQEIPRISRNPKVHYRTHTPPPLVSILGQSNPVHIPRSHLLEIHPNIVHPSTPRSPQWSLSLQFPHQDAIRPLSSPIRATCPAHRILLDFITLALLYFSTLSLSWMAWLFFFGGGGRNISHKICVWFSLPFI